MPPHRSFAQAPTETLLDLLDASSTGSLSASEITRQHCLVSDDVHPDTLRKALGESHVENAHLKRERDSLKAKNARLETDLRLLKEQIKAKKHERKAPEDAKAVAARAGAVYLFFTDAERDKEQMFGPEPPSTFDPEGVSLTDLDGLIMLRRYQLRAIVPPEYHDSLSSSKTELARALYEGGNKSRSSHIQQLRTSFGKILGPDFPDSLQFNTSVVSKATGKSKDRLDCPQIRTLLGYRPPSKEGGLPSYGLLPLFFWQDFTKYGRGFMTNPILFRAGRCIAYGPSSIDSAEEVRARKNNTFNCTGFTPRATDEFVACVAMLILYILSPDVEFSAGGKGDKSGIDYYATYRAVISLLATGERLRDEVLTAWDQEVFPLHLAHDVDWSDRGETVLAEHPELQAAARALELQSTSRAASAARSTWEDNLDLHEPSVSSPPAQLGPAPLALETSLASLTLAGPGDHPCSATRTTSAALAELAPLSPHPSQRGPGPRPRPLVQGNTLPAVADHTSSQVSPNVVGVQATDTVHAPGIEDHALVEPAVRRSGRNAAAQAAPVAELPLAEAPVNTRKKSATGNRGSKGRGSAPGLRNRTRGLDL
ncbi:hypothetical protein BKA70DRAFT_1228562 [Coprinopsis sp. MPI-PUGE-AT-0042]|nr:hypothetical protein BKA70DRAFT_1228562 [Coprinopsis sp. MPI-PUGE-AT-0042]